MLLAFAMLVRCGSRWLSLFLAVASAACSGSSSNSSPPPASLSTGTYTYSGSSLTVNGCNLGGGTAAGFDGHAQQITVSGQTLLFDATADPVVLTSSSTFTGTLNAGAFSVPSLSWAMDWTTTAGQLASGLQRPLSTGYPCLQSDLFTVSGTVTGFNRFSRVTEIQWALVSGSASVCTVAINSAFGIGLTQFPCQSSLSQNAAL